MNNAEFFIGPRFPHHERLSNPFHSFWMGGYECTDMINRYGNRVDLLQASGHLNSLEKDFESLRPYHIKTVREGIRWSFAEPAPYEYDWCETDRIITAAKAAGLQVLWDLCHFGMPADLSPLHPQFLPRFAALCSHFVQHYRSIDAAGTLIITPINEVSFLSWLGGEMGLTVPFTKGYGWEVKYALTKAYIAGIKAMKAIDDNLLIMSTEPLVDIVAPRYASPEHIMAAAVAHEDQYQVTDMLCGRICAELGGNEDLVDIIGCNFYYSNRFSEEPGDILGWVNEQEDERFRPLHEMLNECYARYRRPLILAETSHPKEDRPHWLQHIAEETALVISAGLPFWGVCWYPIIDRPDWDEPAYWHQSGLWDRIEDKAVLCDALGNAWRETIGKETGRSTAEFFRAEKMSEPIF